MKILRLSMFNLKKNKKEAVAIAFLTMIATVMLAIFMMDLPKMNSSFDESFCASGSFDHCMGIKYENYRDEYRDILGSIPGVKDITEDEFLSLVTSEVEKDGETLTYSLVFMTDKGEKKIESFAKRDKLDDETIAQLSHPIWLPVYFQISENYQPGDIFTVIKYGVKQDFEIAGFYETGLMSDSSFGYKCIVSQSDYELYSTILTNEPDGRYTGLWFNYDGEFDFSGFRQKCAESSSENIDSHSFEFGYELEKESSLTFIGILLYFLAFFSAVSMLSALFVITHRISNDIEDQMQQIGVLEALGYKASEISLSYVGEYLICGGIGSVPGGIIALCVSPAMDMGIQSMSGRTVKSSLEILGLLPAVLLITALVIGIALLKAAKVRKYPPVTALRKGISTHHFGRNILPLERSKGSINLALAFKSFMGDLRSAFGIVLCIVISGIAIFTCANYFDFFKDGIDGLLSMSGIDLTVNVELMNGVDPCKVKDEIEAFPEVRKVLLSYSGLTKSIPVKGSSYHAWPLVFEDYKESENIVPTEGRFPLHDNEVMVTVQRCKRENLSIGDSIVLEGNGIENKYIITGITSSIMNNGNGVYFTTDGFLRTEYNAHPTSLSVYLNEGVQQEDFEKKLNELYGKSVKECLNSDEISTDPAERMQAAADKKMAALISYYGVTNADYAVVTDSGVITGNSRGFVIKEVSSFLGIAKMQMGPISAVMKIGSIIAVLVISAIVAVILALIVSSTVKRQRKRLGIMKGMGYTSKDLMLQITLKTMPVSIVSVIIAAILTKYIYSAFWLTVFGVISDISLTATILTAIMLVMFCYAVTYICACKVKAISVTELMTE